MGEGEKGGNGRDKRREGEGKEGEKKVAFPNFEPQTPDCNDFGVIIILNQCSICILHTAYL